MDLQLTTNNVDTMRRTVDGLTLDMQNVKKEQLEMSIRVRRAQVIVLSCSRQPLLKTFRNPFLDEIHFRTKLCHFAFSHSHLYQRHISHISEIIGSHMSAPVQIM